MTTPHLRRIDDARKMRRFYLLNVQPDLFGGVLLVKQWGSIGTGGRIVEESYGSEALAADAMRKQADPDGAARLRGAIGGSWGLSSNGTENLHKLVHASSTPTVRGSRARPARLPARLFHRPALEKVYRP